ncbi:MAG: hypothetical protein ACT6XY_19210 [Phreatobacter sp.]|uniref:hypothetical protein n=1 Tax=Phreatobacter sp. TaxID=1966341 RepID=UPI0040368637
MSIQQKDTRRTTAPVTIDLTATEVPGPPAPDRPKPAAPSADAAGAAKSQPTPASREEFDVLNLAPVRYDRWDRLYRNIVLVIFAVGMVAGFWLRG